MAFCTFSKDLDNGYTIVDNKFITKYLPEADGFAVKVYLYGLYLCENRETDFSISSMAEVLKTTEENIRQAFAFWEDFDLVEVLAQEPFTVQCAAFAACGFVEVTGTLSSGATTCLPLQGCISYGKARLLGLRYERVRIYESHPPRHSRPYPKGRAKPRRTAL